jgi:hypothetical protein
MDRKWFIGIGVGLIATATLVAVGAGAYEMGQRSTDRVLVAATETAGGRIVVDHGWGRGGPGHLVVPLLIVGAILLFASRRRRWCGPGPGWDAEWRYRHGWHGYDQMAPPPPGASQPPPAAPPTPDRSAGEREPGSPEP